MRLFHFFILILPILFLAGCGERQELEEQAFVVVLGLDKAKEDHLINVTFQIANPQVNTSSVAEAQNEPPTDIVTFTAPDILAAKELASTSLSRKVTFAHLKTIIVGESLAKSDYFDHVIGSATIDPELRRESVIIVSKEKASTLIQKNKPALETRPHKYYEFMEQRWKETGLVSYSSINQMFHRADRELFLGIYATAERNKEVEEDETDYLAGQVPQKSGDPVQMIGSAVFKNRKMIGYLDGEETRLALLMRRKTLNEPFFQSFPDPLKNDYRITVKMRKLRPASIQVNTKQDPPQVRVKVPLAVTVNSNPALVNYTTSEKHWKLLEKSIAKDLKEKADNLVKKTQTEFKSEPFVWYLFARKNFWTMQEFEEYNWDKQYTNADVDINFHIKIESFGEQIDPPTNVKQEKGGAK